jgi:membrane protein YdbS with pleckstrin-like domain
VQNVETRQTLFERVLRIGTVDFDTAASDDSQFAFVGIATPKLVVAAVDRAQQLMGRTDPLGGA